MVIFEDKPTKWVQLFGALLAGFFAFIIFGFLVKRRKEKGEESKKTLLYMELTVAFLATAALIDGIILLFNEFYPIKDMYGFDLIDFGSHLSFSLNAIANVFLLAFAKEVFQINKNTYGTVVIFQILVVPLLMTAFFLKEFLIPLGLEDLDLIPLGLHVAMSVTIYVMFTIHAFKIRKLMKLETENDRMIRKALTDLGTVGIFLLLAVISFVSHEVIYFAFLTSREYISVAMGWILGGIAAFFMYSGYVSPEMVKREP